MSEDNSKDKQQHIVYTIEQCKVCGVKNKRTFKVGDYVYKDGGSCLRCKGNTLVIMIYAEPINSNI